MLQKSLTTTITTITTVKDVYVFCVDCLTGFREAKNAIFPQNNKNKPSFTNDDSLRKMLYLASNHYYCSRKLPKHSRPRQLSGTEQLRGNPKICLFLKLLFGWVNLLLHKLFCNAIYLAFLQCL